MEINSANPRVGVDGLLYLSMGRVFYIMGELEKSLNLFEFSLSVAELVNDIGKKAAALTNISLIQQIRGEIQLSYRNMQQVLSCWRDLGDRSGERRALSRLASLAFDQGRIEEAERLCLEAMAMTKEFGLKIEEAMVLSNLGNITGSAGRYAESVNFYEQALEICRLVGDVRGQAINCHGLSIYLFRLERMSEAMKFAEESLQFSVQSEDLHSCGHSHALLATIYSSSGQVGKAKDSLDKAIQIQEKIGHPRHEFLLRTEKNALLRRIGERSDEHLLQVEEASNFFIQSNNALEVAPCIAEMIYQILDRNEPVQPVLQAHQPIISRFELEAKSEAGQMISKMLRTVKAFEEGRRLFRGELLEDLPEGLRNWLVANGHLDLREYEGDAGWSRTRQLSG